VVQRVGIHESYGVGEATHEHLRGRVWAGVIHGARRGQDFFAQFGRQLIGPAEGIGNGCMGDTDEARDVAQCAPRLQGRFMAAERRLIFD
jgi:hypothetical protein